MPGEKRPQEPAPWLPQDPEPWREAMVRRLAKGDFPDRVADDLLRELAEVEALRSLPARPFPYGIKVPDGITLKAVIPKEQIHNLLNALLASNRLESIRIFPKGIIDPDIFVGEFDFR